MKFACLHPPIMGGDATTMILLSENDAFNSNSITYILTFRGYGHSRFNRKHILLDNNLLIKLGVSDNYNSCNHFPWAIALLVQPKLDYFGYFII